MVGIILVPRIDLEESGRLLIGCEELIEAELPATEDA
jgi:hypothetical protein